LDACNNERDNGEKQLAAQTVDLPLLQGSRSIPLTLRSYQFVCVLYAIVPFLYFNSVGKAWPKIQSFFEAVRLNEGSNLPIGISGFCWGGKHAFIIAQGQTAPNGKPLIDAAFTAHPSFLKIPDEVVGVKKPISVAIGDKDNNIKPPQIEVIKRILENEVPVHGEVKVYPGAGKL